MTVEILAHLQDMVEQLMIIRGHDKPGQVVEEAIEAMYAALPDEEKEKALARMIEDGVNSGVYEGAPFEEIYARLDAKIADENSRSKSHEAA